MNDGLQLALVLTPIFLGTLCRSTFGFGDALIAMPLLALAIELDVARPLVALSSATMAGVIVWRDWQSVHHASAWRLALWGIAGIPFGFLLIGWLDENVVKSILAVLVIGYAVYSLASRHALVFKTERASPLFGFFSGLLGGAYNTGGPPLVIYGTARGWTAEQFRATMHGVYLPVSLCIAAGHAAIGKISRQVLFFYLLSLPLMFVAIVLGKALNRRLGKRRFLVYVYWLLIFIGVALLANSLPSSAG